MNKHKNFKETLDSLPEISVEEAAELIAQNGATDRYQALGIAYPNPATMCGGE